MKMQRVFLVRLSAAWLTLTAGVAEAATYTWNNGGGADVNWTTAANWGGAGYPHVTGDIATLSLADDVTLDAPVTLGRISVSNSVARTVNVTGTGGSAFTFSGISSPNCGFQVGGPADNRLVIQPNIITSVRIDKQWDGTLEIQGKITNTVGSGYGFIQSSGLTVFSGSSALVMPGGIAGIGMSPTLTRMILTNAAAWTVSEIQTGVAGGRTGSVIVSQDSADTSVTATKITLGVAGTANSYKDYYYLRDGWLSAGAIQVGKIMPGVFDMSGGTLLLRGGDITTSVTNGEFRLGGGTWQVTNLNSSTFSYCRMPVKVSGAATMEMLSTGRLYLSGGVSGSANLTRTGAGTLSLDVGTTNRISGSLTISNGLVQAYSNSLIESYAGSTNAWSMKICNGGTFALTHDTSILTQPLDLDIRAGGFINFALLADGDKNYNIIVARTFVTNGVSVPQGRYMSAALPGIRSGNGSGAVVVPATWIGAAGDGKWSTGANWSTGVCPNGDSGVADLSLAAGPVTLDTNVRLTCLIYNPQGVGRELTVTGDSAIEFWPLTTSPNLFVGPGRKLTLNVPVTLPTSENYNGLIYGGGTVAFQKGCPVRASNPIFSLYGTMVFTGTNALGTGQIRTGSRGKSHDGTVVFGTGCVMSCANIINHPMMLAVGGVYNVNYPVYPVTIIHDGGDVTSGSVWLMRHQEYTAVPFGYFMRSGSLTTTDSSIGITLGGYFSSVWTTRYPGGRFEMTGGTVETYRFSVGFTDNAVSLQGGDVTLGAGGIVYTKNTNNVPTAYLSSVGPGPVSLGGVVLHAKAAWGSVLDMTLTGTNGDTVVSNATYAVSLAGNLSGAGGLVKMGDGTLTLSGTNTFTGPLAVAEGTLSANLGLVNATNLSVTASGAMLTLGSADSLNTNATLTVAAGGLLNLNYSGTATVNALVVAGEEKSPGTYTSGRSYITGTGALVVRSGPPTRGTLLTVQ